MGNECDGEAMGLLIKIERESKKALFRQIMDQIIDLVESGILKSGDRLPASRSMAESVGVDRSTVYKAYQELWARGYLESRPGAYSTIRKRARRATRTSKPQKGVIDWPARMTPASGDVYDSYIKEKTFFPHSIGPEVINFVPLSPDSRLFPMEAFRKCMNHVLSWKGVELLKYGSPFGYEPLREFIAERMQLHGVSVDVHEIMISTGAQNGIELLLKLLVQPGSCVVFESPTYSRAVDIFRMASVKLIEVPMISDGMDLEALETLMNIESPALVYTIPNFHNPTGITTNQDHRERLLGICRQHGVPLVEDGFEEEMKYFGKAVLPIKSMDRGQVVIYLGTFSKVLFPGLRIGWIAADRTCIEHLFPIQRASILSGNLLDQAALDHFCRSGYYDLHIKRMHRVYRRRMLTALREMKACFRQKRISWTRPAGGYTIWIQLKGLSMSEADVVAHILHHGVMVLPGSTHFYGQPDGIYFRLSIAELDEAAIETGIKRLGSSLDQLYRKTKRSLN
jgi:DNA-binding transcriptional MocR family regulator